MTLRRVTFLLELFLLVTCVLGCALPLRYPVDPEEIGDGAAANLGLRLLPSPWRDAPHRFVVFSAVSFGYELLVDPHHPGNVTQARLDVRDRLLGYLGMEVFAWVWAHR